MSTLTEHAAGNLRLLANMSNELLTEAVRREAPQIDLQLYLDLFTPQTTGRKAARA